MEFYTVKEIRNMLRINTNKAYALCQQEDFPAIKIGSNYRIPKDAFREWCERKAKE